MNVIPYGTPDWYAARLGRVTASRMADLTAKTKTGWGAGRLNYMAELLIERLTGVPAEGYTSPAMQWGIDHEGEARAAYEFYTDVIVREGGFIQCPSIEMAGASPDGFVEGTMGIIEIKCPNTATHLDTLLNQTIPGKYMLQMQFQMACANALWCDFVSFDPRMPESMRLFVKRVERDTETIDGLERDVRAFLAELDNRLKELRALYP